MISKEFQLFGHTFCINYQSALFQNSAGDLFFEHKGEVGPKVGIEALNGFMDSGALQIYINSSCPPSVQEETIWHEAVEAINAMCEMGLTHPHIQTLGAGIHQIIKTMRSTTGQGNLPQLVFNSNDCCRVAAEEDLLP